MTNPKQPISTAFRESLESALKNFGAPEWLGENSVLATPYFLGDRLEAQLNNSRVRGRTLQKLLLNATAEIQGTNAERYRAILRLRYFDQDVSVEAAMGKVGLSKNAFHENRHKALGALEAALRRSRPSFIALGNAAQCARYLPAPLRQGPSANLSGRRRGCHDPGTGGQRQIDLGRADCAGSWIVPFSGIRCARASMTRWKDLPLRLASSPTNKASRCSGSN